MFPPYAPAVLRPFQDVLYTISNWTCQTRVKLARASLFRLLYSVSVSTVYPHSLSRSSVRCTWLLEGSLSRKIQISSGDSCHTSPILPLWTSLTSYISLSGRDPPVISFFPITREHPLREDHSQSVWSQPQAPTMHSCRSVGHHPPYSTSSPHLAVTTRFRSEPLS